MLSIFSLPCVHLFCQTFHDTNWFWLPSINASWKGQLDWSVNFSLPSFPYQCPPTTIHSDKKDTLQYISLSISMGKELIWRSTIILSHFIFPLFWSSSLWWWWWWWWLQNKDTMRMQKKASTADNNWIGSHYRLIFGRVLASYDRQVVAINWLGGFIITCTCS